MIRSDHPRWWDYLVAGLALAVLALAAVVIRATYRAELVSSKGDGAGSDGPALARDPNRRFEMKGIVRPPAVPADRAELGEDDEVIGVVVGGKARAYELRALHVARHHVVNDLVDSVPISVAYCDITECTRVYTRRGTTVPLDVWQSGFGKGGLILKIEGVSYRHQSGEPLQPGPDVPPIPYEEYPWIRTTWKDWKQQHPGTDVYCLRGATSPKR